MIAELLGDLFVWRLGVVFCVIGLLVGFCSGLFVLMVVV